jgi:hypothetical protein
MFFRRNTGISTEKQGSASAVLAGIPTEKQASASAGISSEKQACASAGTAGISSETFYTEIVYLSTCTHSST